MRAVIQRVKRAEVRVDGDAVGRIGPGLLVLVGIGKDDNEKSGEALADKIAHLRVFDDEQGRMNRSLLETQGSVLCVSQFTLYGDCRKGRRPSYDQAAPPGLARSLYDAFLASLRGQGLVVQSGQFQARMDVELINDGPVTLLLDTEKVF